jgi:tetraacyldisaccharide 4'-kinase
MKISRSVSLALWPLSQVYGSAVRLRTIFYRAGIFREHRLKGTVISVGNLTVGGTGKTPMVLWLAERLAAEGQRPAILTRGYRGKKQTTAAGEVQPPTSDEVALLRRRLGESAEYGVGKNRFGNGRSLEQQGARWFILDDGFQHLALGRDVDIVMLDASDAFGGGRLLPAGRLREPRSGLRRADVIVITRADHAPAVESIVRRFSDAPIFYAHTELASLESVGSAAAAESSEAQAAQANRTKIKFFAFCGIGNADAFFYDLRRWGFSLAGELSFADHHRYTARDIARLQSAARAAGAEAMICTEKDIFNLGGAPAMSMPVYACKIRLALSDGEAFWKTVLEATRSHRAENEA